LAWSETGVRQKVVVKLTERPLPESTQRRVAPGSDVRPASARDQGPLGLTVRDLDRATAMRQSLPDTLQGVVVVDVDPAGPARLARLRPGHLILEINRRPVTSAGAFQHVLAGLKPGEVAVLLVFDQLLDQRILVAIATDGGS
jgi:serine protease Do